MALRLMEVITPGGQADKVAQAAENLAVLAVSRSPLAEDRIALRFLVAAEETEALSDAVAAQLDGSDGFRILLLPVEATLPTPEESLSEEERRQREQESKNRDARVSREELYEDISARADLSTAYLSMIALSSVVAAVGLLSGDVAAIIGAMVIAPLLGPNVALALAVTLGDTSLSWRALKTGAAGLGTAAAVSLAMGLVFSVDPLAPEIAKRTVVGTKDVVLALSAGAAGALAISSGLPAVLIGVMVAVALLPPLAAAGLLAGAGHALPAAGAILLLLVNVACINLAGVLTFVARGIHPRKWWEAEKARKATRVALLFWSALLGLLLLLILALWRR